MKLIIDFMVLFRINYIESFIFEIKLAKKIELKLNSRKKLNFRKN